jgi:hypothetical protein
MRGNTIANRGYLCEEFVTENINLMCAWEYKKQEITNYDLSDEQKFKIWFDSKVIANVIVDYVKPLGVIREALHIGNKQAKGVKEITGLESPADVLLKFDDSWFGISLKYGASSRRVKVYAPPFLKFAENLDTVYREVYDQNSNLPHKIEMLIDDKMDDAEVIIEQNQDLLQPIFGKEVLSLNKPQRSTIRKIGRGEIIHPDPQAVQDFYVTLRKAASGSNVDMADEYWGTMYQIMADDHGKDLFRTVTNIPKPNTDTYLPTVIVDATINAAADPTVKIYDYVTDIDNYLSMLTEPIPLNKKPNRCCFKFGPANIEVNGRAGSRSEGAVNITLDKKILTNVRFQEIPNRKEDQGESDRHGQTQGQVEGVPTIPGGPRREGQE